MPVLKFVFPGSNVQNSVEVSGPVSVEFENSDGDETRVEIDPTTELVTISTDGTCAVTDIMSVIALEDQPTADVEGMIITDDKNTEDSHVETKSESGENPIDMVKRNYLRFVEAAKAGELKEVAKRKVLRFCELTRSECQLTDLENTAISCIENVANAV